MGHPASSSDRSSGGVIIAIVVTVILGLFLMLIVGVALVFGVHVTRSGVPSQHRAVVADSLPEVVEMETYVSESPAPAPLVLLIDQSGIITTDTDDTPIEDIAQWLTDKQQSTDQKRSESDELSHTWSVTIKADPECRFVDVKRLLGDCQASDTVVNVVTELAAEPR